MKGWPPNGASNYSNHVAIGGFAALKMGDVLLRLFMCHPVNPTYSYFECVRSLWLMAKNTIYLCASQSFCGMLPSEAKGNNRGCGRREKKDKMCGCKEICLECRVREIAWPKTAEVKSRLEQTRHGARQWVQIGDAHSTKMLLNPGRNKRGVTPRKHPQSPQVIRS